MICVNHKGRTSSHINFKVLQCQNQRQCLLFDYGVIKLVTIEFPREEAYWPHYTLVISLQQDGACSHLTGINLEQKGPVESRCCQNRGRAENSLDLIKGLLTFWRPHKLCSGLQKLSKGEHYSGKVSTEPSVIPHQTEKPLKLFLRCGPWKLFDGHNLRLDWSYATLPHYSPQISDSGLSKLALG
ncbi:unnamed protein product [Merluccius merluccius]